VSDVDRAKQFYESLGWRVDADFSKDEWRAVQLTPPGSPCSVFIGKDLTTAQPGSLEGTFLVVEDIQAARAALAARGVEVSEVFHFENNILRVTGHKGRLPGPDPERHSYFSFASFSDPDGNTWLLQEITNRFPGRGFGVDVATLTDLLKEAEEHHGVYEAQGPKHHWSGWYAAYLVARQQGKTTEAAAREGALHIERSR
jgi:catechol 2,3-dioxygenase-like lactoylglutathione lyase family enzyme